jgi:hypothetical protein
MIGTFNIQEINFDQNSIFIKIDGSSFKIPLEKASEKLKKADGFQRNLYKISPSGYGIHWPLIDEDLSIEFLLKLAIKD